MSNNKQQTAVELLQQIALTRDLNLADFEKFKEIEKDQMEAAIIKQCAEQSTSEASKYAEGYSEGYKRALGLIKWNIENQLNKENEQR